MKNRIYRAREMFRRAYAEETEMSTHAGMERMLAVYRSLDELQRRDVDAHVKVCSTCSDRWAVYKLDR